MSNSKFVGACPSIHHSYDKRDVGGIKRALEMHSVAKIKDVISQHDAEEAVLSIFEKVIYTQGLLPEYRVIVWGKDGRELHPRRDRAEFLEVVSSPLSTRQRKNFENGWPMHIGFGAPCDQAGFHLEMLCKMREDPFVYNILKEVFGMKNLTTTWERPILKMPTYGDVDFMHGDFSIAQLVQDLDLRRDTGKPLRAVLSGKVNFTTKSKFRFVPGTGSEKFMREFYRKYRPIYPKFGDLKATKTALDVNEADPMMLKERIDVITVAAREWVVWTLNIHLVSKKPADEEISWGMYLGGHEAVERPRYKEICGIGEWEDRQQTWQQGRAMKLWPSLDKVHLYPHKWDNFKRMMRNRLDKMPPGHPTIFDTHQANGEPVKRLKEPLPVGHSPYPFTQLGMLMNGLLDYEAFEAAGGDVQKLVAEAVAVADAAVADAPLSEVMQGKQPADADDSDDAGPARAGWKRKRIDALDSSDEDEPAAARADDGGAAADASVGGAAADDSDDDVIFVGRGVAPVVVASVVVDLTGDY